MKKTGLVTIICAFMIITYPTTAMAAGEPGIVTGTKNLLEAATTWLLILIPAGCATMIGWHAFVKQMNEGDPAQAAIHNRAMKNALIAGAIGISAVGIVKAFLSFYGG